MHLMSMPRAVLVAAAFTLVALPAKAQNQADLQLRIDRLQTQVQELTGMVEDLTFRVQDLERLVEVLRADNEALFQILAEAGISGVAATPAPAENEPVVVAAPAEDAPVVEGPALVAADPPAAEAPPANDGGGGGPLDLAGALRPDGGFNLDAPPGADDGGDVAAVDPAANPSPPAALGDALSVYDRGYNQVLNGDYSEAEQTFQSFLAAYPGHELTGDARFWLAESLYSRGAYREAATEFYNVYVAFPGHEKAPEMLLKLGMSLASLGQTESACDTFALTLQSFPDAANALRQRVAAEQANAGC